MMRKTIPLILSSVALSGCLTSNVLVTVRADGSGTIEYTTVVRPAAVAEFDKLLAPDPAAARPDADISDPRQWRVDARLGYGVRLLSSRPIKTAETLGWTVTYEFDSVETLGVDLMPVMPGMRGFYGIAAKTPLASTRLRAALEPIPDGMERLTVRFPRFEMDTSAEPPASWASGTPEEMAALRNVFAGSRLTIAVQTEAPLVRTNSPFRDGNRVTLLDADVAEALFSKPISMLVTVPASFEELLTTFADLPGVTLAREHDITLDFPNPSLDLSTVADPAQSAADTDVFLASLSTAGGQVVIGPPTNISRSPGYDNQPSFTPDGRSVLFASARTRTGGMRDRAVPATAAPPQTDIYRYDISSRTVWRITNAPEAEYSPAAMGNGERISLVRVEVDSTQRLWSVTDAGLSAAVLLPDLKPVGYYAWMDERTVALFVLGDRGQPGTLQVADITTGKASLVATDIGRSLQRMPSGAISFVQRQSTGPDTQPTAALKELKRTPAGELVVAELVRPAGGLTDPFIAWTPDGTALMAIGSTLYRWKVGEHDWTPVANLGAFRLHDISRLAVSPKGDRLAIVARQGTSIAR